MMKNFRILLIAICAIATTGSAMAQSRNSEQLPNRIKVAYGDAFYTTVAYGLLDGIISGTVFRDVDEIDCSGTFSVGYRHLSANERWAFGGDFSYAGFTEKLKDGTKTSLSIFSVMAAAECYYIRTGIVRLYGTAEIGGSFTNSGSGLAFQVNPIALRVGNNRIAGFAEVGAGTKGMFNVGLEVGF